MKVLFATKNPAKVRKYADKLKEHGIELITGRDLEIDIKVNESGKNAIENAFIKAKAYYEKTGIISLSCVFAKRGTLYLVYKISGKLQEYR